MHKINGVNIKRLVPEIVWNIAPSKISASLTAIIPTLSTQYQQGGPRRVIPEFIMSSETRRYAWGLRASHMSETRSGGGRGKKKRRLHSMAQPRTAALKVFGVSMLTILENSDRVDSAQTTVKFSAS